jgi:hypothetical protein
LAKPPSRSSRFSITSQVVAASRLLVASSSLLRLDASSLQPRDFSPRTPGDFFRVEKVTKKTLKKLRFLRIFLDYGGY